MLPNNRFQPTFLPPLRYGRNAAEPGRSREWILSDL